VPAVASKLTTVSAQDMIKAMIAGQLDPRKLAGLARTRMKAKHDDLVEALDGCSMTSWRVPACRGDDRQDQREGPCLITSSVVSLPSRSIKVTFLTPT
jgi:hypothetical protein